MKADDVIAILERTEALISPQDVGDAYDDVAGELSKNFSNKRPVLVSVLNGGLLVASELIRRCNFPLEIDTIRVSRYRNGVRGGELVWHVRPSASLKGRHVVLLDDVIDIGKTLSCIKDEIAKDQPASITTVVLIKKAITGAESRADIVGLEMPDRFLVGEGMDLAGYGRNMKGIWALTSGDEATFSKANQSEGL